ncbi:hypothetical protein FACS1894166_09950 [Bacilli bacterium]|nr:hypothetical protein FACS1894166_09950 [Bacilli bacterium]
MFLSNKEHILNMKIQKIAIKDFKNFQATQTFDLSHQYIIIKGDNGVGKTSIFDAIF